MIGHCNRPVDIIVTSNTGIGAAEPRSQALLTIQDI